MIILGKLKLVNTINEDRKRVIIVKPERKINKETMKQEKNLFGKQEIRKREGRIRGIGFVS